MTPECTSCLLSADRLECASSLGWLAFGAKLLAGEDAIGLTTCRAQPLQRRR